MTVTDRARGCLVGLACGDALTKVQQGVRWNAAGVKVWEDRPEGSNAGT